MWRDLRKEGKCKHNTRVYEFPNIVILAGGRVTEDITTEVKAHVAPWSERRGDGFCNSKTFLRDKLTQPSTENRDRWAFTRIALRPDDLRQLAKPLDRKMKFEVKCCYSMQRRQRDFFSDLPRHHPIEHLFEPRVVTNTSPLWPYRFRDVWPELMVNCVQIVT